MAASSGGRLFDKVAIGPGLVRTGLTEGMWLVPGIVEEFDENAPLATTTRATRTCLRTSSAL